MDKQTLDAELEAELDAMTAACEAEDAEREAYAAAHGEGRNESDYIEDLEYWRGPAANDLSSYAYEWHKEQEASDGQDDGRQGAEGTGRRGDH